jgi:3-hydroxybutyryl-CoA dehydrogenase
VEVIRAGFTPPELVQYAKDFLKQINHLPVVCRESPGFLINRIQVTMLAEIHRIVDEGLATVEDVDLAVRLSLGPRWALWGALACEDLIVSKRNFLSLLEYMEKQTGLTQYQPTEKLKALVSEGQLGAVAGEGWYSWKNPYPQVVMERDRQLTEILDWLQRKDSALHLGY